MYLQRYPKPPTPARRFQKQPEDKKRVQEQARRRENTTKGPGIRIVEAEREGVTEGNRITSWVAAGVCCCTVLNHRHD